MGAVGQSRTPRPRRVTLPPGGDISWVTTMAKAKGEEKITLPLINDAYVRFMAQEEQYLYNNRSKTSSEGQLGSHEEISVQRHKAHDPKKNNP